MLASRLAGSMVTTTVSRPRRAPSIASVAAVVVLPTPPVPQQIDDVAVLDDVGESTSSCGTTSSSARDPERELVGQDLDLASVRRRR